MSTVFDRTAIALFIILLTISAAIVPVGAAAFAQSADASDDPSLVGTEDLPEADATVTRIELEADGTARWSIAVRTRLANESDVDDYRAFQEQFRAERETYRDRFERRMTGVVSGAAETTGRNMTASAFRAETSIQELPRRWGVVTYSVTWTNFAAVEGDADAVVVGDVFEGGLYLGESDYLEVAPPEGYAPATTSPPPTETEGRTVVWIGPEDFADRQPTVRFEPAESGPTDSSEAGESNRWLSPTAVGVAAASVVVLVGVALVAVSDRSIRSLFPASIGPSAEGNDGGGASTDVDEPDRTAAPGESSTDADDTDDGASDSDVDPDLLTDEDRVRRLLERNDGRMRQAAIAEELEWSASKTSRVVSGMADDETVEKLRIGRENVIDLLEESD